MEQFAAAPRRITEGDLAMTLTDRVRGYCPQFPKRRVTSVLNSILWALLMTSPIALGQNLPMVPHAQVTDITPKPGWFTEPSIAINALNPQQVAAAFQDN